VGGNILLVRNTRCAPLRLFTLAHLGGTSLRTLITIATSLKISCELSRFLSPPAVPSSRLITHSSLVLICPTAIPRFPSHFSTGANEILLPRIRAREVLFHRPPLSRPPESTWFGRLVQDFLLKNAKLSTGSVITVRSLICSVWVSMKNWPPSRVRGSNWVRRWNKTIVTWSKTHSSAGPAIPMFPRKDINFRETVGPP
jgi:hypothetical protein